MMEATQPLLQMNKITLEKNLMTFRRKNLPMSQSSKMRTPKLNQPKKRMTKSQSSKMRMMKNQSSKMRTPKLNQPKRKMTKSQSSKMRTKKLSQLKRSLLRNPQSHNFQIGYLKGM